MKVNSDAKSVRKTKKIEERIVNINIAFIIMSVDCVMTDTRLSSDMRICYLQCSLSFHFSFVQDFKRILGLRMNKIENRNIKSIFTTHTHIQTYTDTDTYKQKIFALKSYNFPLNENVTVNTDNKSSKKKTQFAVNINMQ